MTKTLKETIRKYEATGRLVFVYPKLKRISLNGGRSTDFQTALKSMRDCLKRENSGPSLVSLQAYADPICPKCQQSISLNERKTHEC